MLEKIVRGAGTLLLAGAIFAGGCTMNLPVKKSSKFWDNKVFTQTSVRFGYDIAKVDAGLSREARDVPIHNDDGGYLKGGVIVDDNNMPFRFRFGLEGSIGTDDLRLYTGGDAYIAPSSSVRENETKQNLPIPYESYAYGGVTQRSALMPFVGIRKTLGDNYVVSTEYGFPHARFKFEKGHYRWDSYEAAGYDSCTTDGRSFSFGLYRKTVEDDMSYMGIVFTREMYSGARLAGEKTTIGVESISFVISWDI